MALAFVFSCCAVWQYTGYAHDNPGKPFEKIVYTWLGTDTGHMNYVKHDGTPAAFHADAGFLLDPLSAIWLLFVTGVGTLIHIYSTGYMAHEGGYYRFFGYLNLFMFSMLTLILGNNYVLMFVGWEGVGLCSYLLIGFYFHRHSASTAANKAFIVNRIGDAGFLLGMFTIAWYFGSLRLTEITHMARSGHFAIGDPIITAATLLLFVGACGKSAQLPLYVWLPDAMEGPTPVSALIHAATMVTAGVYMVARSNALFVLAPGSMKTMAFIGAFTALFAASIALVQNDIKRVLAYSTVSQLGYMFLALGVGAFAAGAFHVFTHAFFKALLFLGAGSVIHAMSGEQDMRNMGDLHRRIPITHWTMFIATFAIAGIPPFAGFFSKDEILWQAWSSEGGAYRLLWLVGYATALDDRVLHVPPDVPHFSRPAAHEPRGGTSYPRIPEIDDRATDRSCPLRGQRRMAGLAAQPGWIESLREIPGAGLRPRSRGVPGRRQEPPNWPRARKKKSTPIRSNISSWLSPSPLPWPDSAWRGRPIATPAKVTRSRSRRQRRNSIPSCSTSIMWTKPTTIAFTGRRKVRDVRLGVMGLGEASSWFDSHVIDGIVNGGGWMTRLVRNDFQLVGQVDH